MLNFNGQDIPSFVKVNDVAQSILPPISQNTLIVNQRAGAYDFGNEIGTRAIDVTITVIADSQSDLRYKIRQLADWLYYEEAKKLVIKDEPDKYYWAKVSESSDITEILNVGQGTITFFLSDPYAYGDERVYEFNPTTTEPYAFENRGGTVTFPKFEFEITENTTELSIISDDRYLYFGKPIEVGISEPVDINPLVMNEDFSNITGWTTPPSLADNGVISGGGFVSNGYSISVSDFGEYLGGWHGASIMKSLNSPPIQDFKIRCKIGLRGTHTKPEQLGRIEVIGRDVNNKIIFRQQLRDGSKNAHQPYAYATIGGKEVVATYGERQNFWSDFIGYMDIARRGNSWNIYYSKLDEQKNIQYNQHLETWVDANYQNMDKLASIQLHIGSFKDVAPISSMYIAELQVYDESPPAPIENQVPYILKTGDVLIVDNESGGVFLNGQTWYEHLDPSSRFIKFDKGINGLSVVPTVVTNGKVSFVERWL